MADDHWLEHKLKDVADEFVTLALHLLLVLVHLHLLLNLGLRYFTIFFSDCLSVCLAALLKLKEKFATLRELHLADQVDDPRCINLPKNRLYQLLS